MIIPSEVLVLRLGLNYLAARSSGDWQQTSKFLATFASKGKVVELEDRLKVSPLHHNLLKNCYFLHANVKDESQPQILMKFIPFESTTGVVSANGAGSVEYLETIFLKRDIGTNDYHITNLSRLTTQDEKGTSSISAEDNHNVTFLDLLNVVIPFAIADALCDTPTYFEPHLADHVEAYGVTGKAQVSEFKEKWLAPQRLSGKPAYKLEDPFIADLKENKVTFGFECLIENHVGKGTEHIYLDECLKVNKITAVRQK